MLPGLSNVCQMLFDLWPATVNEGFLVSLALVRLRLCFEFQASSLRPTLTSLLWSKSVQGSNPGSETSRSSLPHLPIHTQYTHRSMHILALLCPYTRVHMCVHSRTHRHTQTHSLSHPSFTPEKEASVFSPAKPPAVSKATRTNMCCPRLVHGLGHFLPPPSLKRLNYHRGLAAHTPEPALAVAWLLSNSSQNPWGGGTHREPMYL